MAPGRLASEDNPFHHSGPVGIDDLIDRDGETAELLAAAQAGNNSRVQAPRRFGKTSLLHRVLGEAGAVQWATVYVDFFGVVTLADVAERIERAYVASLTGSMRRWFEGVARTMRPSVRAGAGGVRAEVALDPAATPLLERLELPRKVFDRWGTRVLVVFDEFQEVLTAHAHADAVIRSVIQHHGDAASYIFAGSHVGMMTELFTDRQRAFYAQARPLVLPPLAADDITDYLEARFDATGKSLGTALAPLLDATAGHPQRTMLLAHAVWAGTSPGETADEQTAESARRRILGELTDEFRALWTGLPATQRRLLTVVADGQTSPFSRDSDGTARRRGGSTSSALAALTARGDIMEDLSALSRYRVVDPMLASWLRAGRLEPT